MGSNTLTSKAEPATVEVADVNQFRTAFLGNLIPRNTSTGAAEDNVHKIGEAAFRWLEGHFTSIFLNGSLFDPDAIGADTKFAVLSGATRTDSGQPDFLRASGSGATATILATATDLSIIANNNALTVDTDIAIASLTLAPSANNTALVNDVLLAGGNETKFTGEDENSIITIDTVGTEISNRVGEYICLKTPTGEFMFVFVQDATTLSHAFRGYFFDSAGAPVVRGVLSNNDTLTIMSLGWVFLDKNGTTVDISYNSPVYSGVEPASPVVDDYWFDLKNRLWKRHNGTSFVSVDRTLIGLLVIDTVNCVASRSSDFTKGYDSFIDLSIELESVTEVKTKKGYSRISVYGQTQELYAGEFLWDIATDLETGVSEAASTDFFLYLTEEGIPKISDEKPYDRQSELKGFYHPYHSWRNVGKVFNDSGSDFNFVTPKVIVTREWIYKKRTGLTGDDIDFTNIPSGVTEIDIFLDSVGMATSTQSAVVQIGDSGGIETSGYVNTTLSDDAVTPAEDNTVTSGFALDADDTWEATSNATGIIRLRKSKFDDNLWVCDSRISLVGGAPTFNNFGNGDKTLTGELDRIRLHKKTATGAFDTGEIQIRYR